MAPSKLSILYHLLSLRLSRKFSSNRVNRRRKNRWLKTIKASPYYNALKVKDEYPLMNKSLFMENFDRINTVGMNKEKALEIALASEASRDFSMDIGNISVGLSSGTSGNKGIFLTSPREKAIWVAAILDRVIGISLKKRKVAFFLRANNNLYESVKSNLLSFSFFDIKKDLQQQIESFISLEADILVAQPSVLLEIAKYCESKNIHGRLKKVISVAEVLEDDHREYFKKIFNCKIDQVYQCTEGFLAYTCARGKLHFNEDWLHIEKKFLDNEKNRYHPIITDYLRESQPMIRYELNDIIHDGGLCDCGSSATVILKIEGRSDDVFEFDENGKRILIYPDFIRRAVITASEEIINYVVTRKGLDLISVSLEVKNQQQLDVIFTCVKKNLMTLFSSRGIDNITFEQADFKHQKSVKFTRIKNEYSTNISD